MSYQRAIGDTWDDVANVISGIHSVKDAAGPVMEILKDPYFPQVVGMLAELHSLEQPSSGSSVPGIGLVHVAGAMKVYVEYRRRPLLVGPLVIGAMVGLPFALGYLFGKGKRR